MKGILITSPGTPFRGRKSFCLAQDIKVKVETRRYRLWFKWGRLPPRDVCNIWRHFWLLNQCWGGVGGTLLLASGE